MENKLPENKIKEPVQIRPDLSALRIHRDDDEPSSAGKSLRAVIIGTVIILAVGAALVAYRLWGSSAFPEVETGRATVDSGSTGLEVLTATGYVVAHRKAAVSPKISGRLEFLGVDIGSRVSPGQVMARLEHRDLDAQLADARANLASLEAARQQSAAELEQSKAQLAQAEASRQKSRLQLERLTKLGEQGVTSKADYDNALAEARVDEAQVNSAQAQIRAAQSKLQSSLAQIQSAAARVRLIEAQIEYTNIRAPFEGLVISKDAEVGETVAPATMGTASTRGSVFTIVDPNTLEVEADINESSISKITTGLPAEVTLDALGDEKLAASAYQIVPTADRQKATVKVKVRFEKIDTRILPDMNAKITFIQKAPEANEQKSRVTVPRSAVVQRNGKSTVLVLTEDRLHEQAVSLGGDYADRVEVLTGLAGGERVVLRPGEELQEGTRVKVRSGS